MRLGKTGVHFLNPYGVRSLRWMVWQSRASSAECRPCITRSCGICNRLNIQFLNVVTGSQGNELTPREEARWKGGRSSQLTLVSLYCVLHKHITYSKLTRGVQACSRGDCTFSAACSFSHLSLTFCHKRLQCLKAQMVESGALAVTVSRLSPLKT